MIGDKCWPWNGRVEPTPIVFHLMSLNFAPTPDTLNALLAVGRITDEQAEELHEEFSTVTDRIETPDGLLAIANSIVSEFTVASALVEQLLSIGHLSRRIGETSVDVIKSAVESFLQLIDSDEENEQIQQSARVLQRLSGLPAFRTTSKAIELLYDCDNLLQRTRIMTDVRPIFAEDPSQIDGAVVSHTLRIRYDSAGNDREMSLALDDRDLRKLIADCERALAKAEAARTKMCRPCDTPTMNMADEQNA